MLAEKRAKDAAEKAATEQVDTFDPALVPEEQYERTDTDKAIDEVVNRIDIVDAYRRWCGKSKVVVRAGQKESIKVSCPFPWHKDEEPSAWINTEKQTGVCRPCGDRGFDAHDIAAVHFGFDVEQYKTDGTFPKLRRTMAESYGYKVERSLGGEYYVVPPQEPEDGSSDTPDTPGKSDTQGKSDTADIPGKSDISDMQQTQGSSEEKKGSGLAAVEDLYSEEEGYEVELPTLDWREIVPGTETFLDTYMAACCKDEAPEEYHFFNGLIALGFAAGREVTLASKLPVYGNLFLCHLGKSGAGKSTASKHLRRLLKRVLPYDANDPNSRGVTNVTPSSAEVLIKSFSKPVVDPVNPKNIAYFAPVRGLIDFNEMSGLIGRTARAGNILKPIMMDFYDMSAEVRNQSLNSGTLIAEHPFASCTTTTQPAALRDLIRDSDDASGFLNRWVFVAGIPKKSTIMGTGEVDLDTPADKLEEIKGWAGSFRPGDRILWSQPALDAMQEFFNTFVYPQKNKVDTNIFVRMDLLFLKLALLLSVNKMEREVTLDTVLRLKKMFTYLMLCYGIPADQIGNSLEHEMTEAIIYQMRRLGKGEGVTLNNIALALKRRKYPKEMILRNIKALIELGFVEERIANAGARGRPSKRYFYVA